MKKALFAAALTTAFCAVAWAQDPTINYVKTITIPLSPTNFLSGHFITSVAADGNNLYVTGSGNDAAVVYQTPLVKIANWNSVPAFSAIFTDNSGGAGGVKGQLQTDIEIWNGNIHFATGLASSVASGAATREDAEMYRLDANGNLVPSAANGFANGFISANDGGLNEWRLSDVEIGDIAIDPGFAPNNTAADQRLAYVRSASRAVRRMLEDGTFAGVPFLGFDPNITPTWMRAFTFDSSGNVYFRISNDVHKFNRTSYGGDTFNGLVNAQGGTTPLIDLPLSTLPWTRIEWVPGGPGTSPFIMFNDYDPALTQGRIIFAREDGSTLTELTGSPNGIFAQKTAGLDSAEVSGTRYMFIANTKPSSFNAVDVYQVGNAGRVSGIVTLENFIPSRLGQIVVVEVKDGSGIVQDRRALALNADGSYSFFSTYRGAGTVTIKGSKWLARAASATIGASPVTFSPSLLNGDISNNNEIGPEDFSALSLAFGSFLGDPNYTVASDLNGDDEVGPADFSILAGNFGEFGD